MSLSREGNLKKHMMSLGLLALMVACNSNQNAKGLKEQGKTMNGSVIYGEDDRVDYFAASPTHQNLADATVALVRSRSLERNGDRIDFSLSNYGRSMGLCPSEPFFEQDTLAFCSGSLVGEDLILTAGHCIRSQMDCKRTSFVFGFAYTEENQAPRSADLDDVYECGDVVHTEVDSNGSDFAVVRLKRKVVGRTPLRVKRDSKAKSGDEIVVIGHPSGLPTKVAGGASVRNDAGTYFVANLDTYGGNSGSAVFDSASGEVAGILVRGETDFRRVGSCLQSNVCTDSGCRGEDVTHIGRALDFIPEL